MCCGLTCGPRPGVRRVGSEGTECDRRLHKIRHGPHIQQRAWAVKQQAEGIQMPPFPQLPPGFPVVPRSKLPFLVFLRLPRQYPKTFRMPIDPPQAVCQPLSVMLTSKGDVERKQEVAPCSLFPNRQKAWALLRFLPNSADSAAMGLPCRTSRTQCCWPLHPAAPATLWGTGVGQRARPHTRIQRHAQKDPNTDTRFPLHDLLWG